jgi:hypothetical protein
VTFHNQVRDRNGAFLSAKDRGPWTNLGFTYSGLEALGYDPYTLKYLPEDFR